MPAQSEKASVSGCMRLVFCCLTVTRKNLIFQKRNHLLSIETKRQIGYRTIIHVELKDTHEHLYFGSVAAMFDDKRMQDLLTIKYQTFRTKGLTTSHPYENEHLIVRKGELGTIDHIK